MNQHTEDTHEKINITTKAILLIPSCVYAIGYLIHSNYYRRIGVTSISIAKPEYIETGLIFCILSIVISFIPYYSIPLIKNLRKNRENKENLNNGVRLVAFCGCNYVISLVLFSLFITRYEWHIKLLNDISIGHFLSYYMVILFTGLIIAGRLRDWVISIKKRYDDAKKFKTELLRFFGKKNYRHISKKIAITKKTEKKLLYISNVILFLLFLYSLVFDYLILTRIKWTNILIDNSKFYLICLTVLTFVIIRLVKAYQKTDNKLTKIKFAIVSSVLPVSLLYLTIIAYSHGVYNFIPSSRGGALPEIETRITMTKESIPDNSNLIEKKDNDAIFLKRLIILNENKNYLFITDNFLNKNKSDFVIYKIAKRNILLTTSNYFNARQN